MTRGFYQALIAAERATHDPTDGLWIKPTPTSPPLLLSEDAVARLLKAALVEPRTRRSPAVRRAVALRNRAGLELLYGVLILPDPCLFG